MSGKRYYWLQLKEDFFSSKRIKKLRKLAGGDTYTIIYLKMQLLAMKTDGILRWTGLEDNFAEELALDLDEAPENVEVTLNYLLSCGLAESSDNINYFLPYAVENVGSEGSSAQRMRAARAKQKQLSGTKCEQSVTLCAHGDGEKEIEKEIQIDKEIDIEREYSEKSSDALSDKKVFMIPTVEEVAEYVASNGYHIDPRRFVDYYNSQSWRIGGTPITDWKAKVRCWESNEKNKPARCCPQTIDMEALANAINKI